MKSLVEEASSVFKALEKAWERADKPASFSVKIYEEPVKGFLGLVKKSAKVGIFFEEKAQAQSGQKDHPRRDGQRRPASTDRTQQRNTRPQSRDARPQRENSRTASTTRTERPERVERTERPVRTERTERPERTERTNQTVRPERTERTESRPRRDDRRPQTRRPARPESNFKDERPSERPERREATAPQTDNSSAPKASGPTVSISSTSAPKRKVLKVSGRRYAGTAKSSDENK